MTGNKTDKNSGNSGHHHSHNHKRKHRPWYKKIPVRQEVLEIAITIIIAFALALFLLPKISGCGSSETPSSYSQ